MAALLAFGLQSASVTAQGLTYASLGDALFLVGFAPGVDFGWQQVGEGVSTLAKGTAAYYSGLVGPLLFDASGARDDAVNEVWSIKNGQIVDSQ